MPLVDTRKHHLVSIMDSQLTELAQAFENTSTSVAAAQMRNALTNLAETVEDPKQKKASLRFDAPRQRLP